MAIPLGEFAKSGGKSLTEKKKDEISLRVLGLKNQQDIEMLRKKEHDWNISRKTIPMENIIGVTEIYNITKRQEDCPNT